jgi:hypothetical protein
MLKNTLILPTDDPDLAARLLRQAIDDLDVILMLVFGTGADVEQIVAWADQLCNKSNFGIGNFRRVVWIPDLGQPVRDVLAPIFTAAGVGALPRVAVLNFHDVLKATLTDQDPIGPIVLEKAFLQGGLA